MNKQEIQNKISNIDTKLIMLDAERNQLNDELEKLKFELLREPKYDWDNMSADELASTLMSTSRDWDKWNNCPVGSLVIGTEFEKPRDLEYPAGFPSNNILYHLGQLTGNIMSNEYTFYISHLRFAVRLTISLLKSYNDLYEDHKELLKSNER